MSAVDRSGVVSISVGGVVQSVPYRRAVGMIATGRATWAEEEPTKPAKTGPKPAKAPKGAPKKPQDAPVTPAAPVVSVPTRKGAEDEETEYLPSPPDQ